MYIPKNELYLINKCLVFSSEDSVEVDEKGERKEGREGGGRDGVGRRSVLKVF